MPYLKNYRLLISHSWHYESQYSTIVTWLNNTSYFKWSNHSVSADRPLNTKTNQQLREQKYGNINLREVDLLPDM